MASTKRIIYINDLNIDFTPGSFRDYYAKMYGVGFCPCDRFDLLKHIDPQPAGLQTYNIVPEPVYNLSNLTNDWKDRFFSIVDQVADKIYEKAGNRTIVVMWSGGVDSTSALVSLMKHAKFKEYLDAGRFKVAMSSSSILEYPWFFYNKILPSIPFVLADHDKLMLDPNVFMITGDGGDYLIGNTDTPIFEVNGSTDNLCADKSELWKYLSKEEPSGKFRFFVEELCKHAPFEIKSVNQAYWWLGQCFTHQGEMVLAYLWSTVTDLTEMVTFNKVYRFYLDDLFNTFSFEYMSTNPYYTDFNSVRKFAKDYIVDFTGDAEYYNKIKLYSQRFLLRFPYKMTIYEDFTYANVTEKVKS